MMNLEKITYQELLKHIDDLRSKGISDNSPEMLKAKWKLREFLSGNKKSTAIVPKLTSIKTVTLSQAPESQDTPINKFIVLGVVLAIIAVVYKLKN